MDYKFTQSATSAANPGWSLKRNMPFFGVGAKLAVDRFFVDAYAQVSNRSNKAHLETVYTPSFSISEDTDVRRKDYGITFGYGVLASSSGNLSMFVGYKGGKTDFRRFYNSYNLNVTDTFKTNGPFVGVAYIVKD